MRIKGRAISKGIASGPALVASQPISFLGGLDPSTGQVVEHGHELEGTSIKDKVLIFPHGKGSTVGSYVMYQLKKNGVAPCAIINLRCEAIIAIGAIISDIPVVDQLECNPLEIIRDGDIVLVNGADGYIEVE